MYLAKLFGLCYLAVGLGMLLNMTWFKKMLGDFLKNNVMLFWGGLTSLILGLVLVMAHNVWDGAWYVILVTLFGWGALLKGVFYLVLPDKTAALAKKMMAKMPMWLMALFVLVLGLVFCYAGFYMEGVEEVMEVVVE